jgi:hypothetical protein
MNILANHTLEGKRYSHKDAAAKTPSPVHDQLTYALLLRQERSQEWWQRCSDDDYSQMGRLNAAL